MTDWRQTRTTGRGNVDYRLVVAGWPHEWTTSSRVDHFSGLVGRKVYPSLQYDGLRISERASVRNAWTEVQGITFTINPCTPGEETVNGFTRDPIPIAQLAQAIPATGFSATLVLDTGLQLSAGTYHIGTEAFTGFGDNVVTRAQWNTVNEVHNLTYGPTRQIDVPVYDWPPTMEGRRCYLYAYDDADDGFGDGWQIWIGIVAGPPKMSSDGITWTIEAQSVTAAFDQLIGAAEGLEYKLRGIYHSAKCPMKITVTLGFTTGSALDFGFHVRASGFAENQEQWIANVNQLIASMRGNAQIAAGVFANIDSILYEERTNPPTMTVRVSNTKQTDISVIYVTVMSVLEGCLVAGVSKEHDYFFGRDGVVGNPGLGGLPVTAGGIYVEYFGDGNKAFGSTSAFFESDRPPYTYPLPRIRGMLGAPRLTSNDIVGGAVVAGGPNAGPGAGQFYYDDDPAVIAAYPSSRMYLTSTVGLAAGTVLYAVRGSGDPIPIVIDSVVGVVPGGSGNYIEAHVGNGAGVLYFDGNTTFVPLRTFVMNSNLSYFLIQVTNFSVNANDGDTPFITQKDVDAPSLVQAFIQPSGIDSYWYYRNYAFFKPVTVKNVLTQELKMIGWMARLQSDGRLGFTRMPLMAANRTPDATVTDASILLPADGLFGMWPTWEAQADGLVNIVNVKIGFDPISDDYDESYTYSMRMYASIAEHKSSGKATETIEIKSTASTERPNTDHSLGTTSPFIAVGQSEDNAGGFPSSARVEQWVRTYLAIVATEYAIVTVAVPFTYFDLLVGSIVDVTCALIPNGLGGRGVVSKKAYVVGRDWNLDPRSNEMGKLTLYFPRTIGAGYTPSGRVTAQTLTAVNTWKLQFAKTNLYNDAWAERDSDVSLHFAVGDAILVSSASSNTDIFGVVIAKDNTTIPDVPTVTVQTETAWTPGALTWTLTWRRDIGTGHAPVTARQNSYCYVADAQRLLVNGTYARKYV